jgi:hypothetical protein
MRRVIHQGAISLPSRMIPVYVEPDGRYESQTRRNRVALDFAMGIEDNHQWGLLRTIDLLFTRSDVPISIWCNAPLLDSDESYEN